MAVTNRYQRRVEVLLFTAYLLQLCYFLFFAESLGRSADQDYHYNLTLFHEIRRYIVYVNRFEWKYWLINLFGNVIAFIPMGYFIPRIFRKRRTAPAVIFCCFFYSLLIELTQLVTRLGCFDVDDILLNTIGGSLGFFLCWLIHGRKRRRRISCRK